MPMCSIFNFICSFESDLSSCQIHHFVFSIVSFSMLISILALFLIFKRPLCNYMFELLHIGNERSKDVCSVCSLPFGRIAYEKQA